jgi:alkaline phosphatase D
VGNSFYDPARRQWYRSNSPATVTDSSWYSGEPIWATAERNGVKSAAYFWPGSEAAIGGIRPSYWTKYDGKVTNEARVNGVISWLRKPGAERPHLALVYFSDVDDTTHRNGPEAPSTAGVVRNVDHVLAMLVDSIRSLPFRDSVNIVIVSDHGMTATSASRLIGVSEVLIAAGVDTTGIEMSDNGPTLSLWFGGDSVRARRALAALTPVAHMQSYARAGIPERFHVRQSPRIGDLLLVADEGWTIERRLSDRSPSTGAHGYDPALASMQGIFLAAGPNVRALGTIPSFENVNVYPFVAALLHLEHVPKVDGDISVLGGALR